ncbi:MAG: ABC transporter ATP-binding protein [Patescibacteria group bacterium]|nr:ABC transporter ATP-binding protein [Patescibacteria group bacterium]MDD5715321.1 ABC transporter ATP-binding protein [Patescibacteria group bacterium]
MSAPKQPTPVQNIGTAQSKRRGGPMGHGPMGMMMPGQKAKNFKKTMRQLGGYLKPFWISVTIVVIFTIASTVFAIASPKILGNMTNQVVDDFIRRTAYDQIVQRLPAGTVLPPGTTGADVLKKLPESVTSAMPSGAIDKISSLDLSSRPSFDYAKLISIAITLLVLFGLSAIFSYIQGWIMTSVTQKVTYRLRRDISTKIGRMPLRYFDRTTHGEVLSRITNDVDTVSQTLNQSLSQIISSITMIIGILVMMLSISWQMTLVAVITLPLSLGLIMTVVKRSQRYFKLQQDTLGHLNGHIEEMYGGHNVMRVFNGQARSIATFTKHNTQLHGSAWKSNFFSGLLFPIINFVGNIGYVGVAVLGGYLAIHGRINIGDIQAFIQYVSQFNQPVAQTANIANVLQSTAAAAERVFEFMEEAEESADPVGAPALANVRGAVEFDHVHFGYNPDTIIIGDFTAHIQPGQRIAIVGPTGAGKTTMVNLLMRFYDVNSGSISVDGVNIQSIKRSDVRKLFGMVLQDTWLFKGTIRENLAYGKPDATEQEIVEAARAAHVDHFVHSLPHGYDMVLDEEANNISQGEKQLLTIARAMLVKTPMLILDEATSSVDTRTELLIQQAMERLMKGKTSFVIAHRLSTIRNADLILVMRGGNIVEQGKHEQLLAQNGFYASLYNSQFAQPKVA